MNKVGHKLVSSLTTDVRWSGLRYTLESNLNKMNCNTLVGDSIVSLTILRLSLVYSLKTYFFKQVFNNERVYTKE